MTSTTTNAFMTRQTEGSKISFGSLRKKGRDVTSSPEFRVLVSLLLLLILWGSAVATFGYPALIVPVLALVPVIFVVLLLITVGK